VTPKTEQLRNAAQIARTGASNISAAQRRAIYAVQEAQNAGFQVGEDLSVTDTRTSSTAAEQGARQAQAQTHAANINQSATKLLGLETTVSGQLTAAAGDVGTPAFTGTAHGHNGIQLVDFKQDGGPQPVPQPGVAQPPQPPNWLDQYKKDLASPNPQAPPPVAPMPAFGTPPDPGPQPKPGPMPMAPQFPNFGQCVGDQVKASVGKDMVKGGFEGGIKGAITGAAGGAVVTPELAGAGALPGGVLGFVGGFAKGILEAPIKAGLKGAWDCVENPIPEVPKP
jgi:hypothetical protein